MMISAFDLGPITRIGGRVIAVLGRNFHEIFQVRKSHGDYTEVFADRIISDVNQGANWMNIYNSLFSKNCMLNEQVARQVFEILPEEGPMMVILDRAGYRGATGYGADELWLCGCYSAAGQSRINAGKYRFA